MNACVRVRVKSNIIRGKGRNKDPFKIFQIQMLPEKVSNVSLAGKIVIAAILGASLAFKTLLPISFALSIFLASYETDEHSIRNPAWSLRGNIRIGRKITMSEDMTASNRIIALNFWQLAMYLLLSGIVEIVLRIVMELINGL
jgi:hypothetical protein